MLNLFKLTLFALMFVFAPISTANQTEKNDKALISDDEIEVVYFFSYHCSGCFALKDYIGLWSNISGQKIRRIPVFDKEKWREGALLYATLLFLGDTNTESKKDRIEKERFGFHYILYDQKRTEKNEMLTAIQDSLFPLLQGSDFSDAYKNGENALLDIETLLEEVKSERNITTPSFRVSSKSGISWVLLSELDGNAGLNTIKTLKETISQHKKGF